MFHLAQQIARRFGLSVMRNSTFDGLVRERDALAASMALLAIAAKELPINQRSFPRSILA